MNLTIQSITVEPQCGLTVDATCRELVKIMEQFGIEDGFIIHNDRRYAVKIREPFKYWRVDEKNRRGRTERAYTKFW